MQTVSVATSKPYSTVSRTSNGFVLACFFFSTLFFYGSVGKSMAPIANILSPFLLFFIFLSKGNNFNGLLRLSIYALSSILISFLVVGGGWGSFASNVGIVLLIFIFYNYSVTNSEILYFVRCLRLFHVFLLLYILVFRYNEGLIGSFNANSVAIQALVDMIFFILIPFRRKTIQLLLITSSIIVIVYTNSRTCFGAGLIVGVVWLLRNTIQKHPLILKLAFWVVIALSIILPFAYSQFLGDAAQVDDLNELSAENFGKSVFTGRELIWSSAWSQLQKTPINTLFGIGSHFSFDGREGLGSNFHSSFFTVVICCGYLGFLFVSILLYKLLCKDFKYFSSSKSHVLYEKMYYIPVMFTGIFESTLLVGNFAIILYFMLCMINSKKDKRYVLYNNHPKNMTITNKFNHYDNNKNSF